MMTTTKSSAFQIGDNVQYNGKFLRTAMNKGMLGSLTGRIESIEQYPKVAYATVIWMSPMPLPANNLNTIIDTAKLKKVK